MYNKPDLRVNFIPITFDKETFEGSELHYKDEEQFKDLKDSHRDSHVILRRGDIIKCVPLKEDGELLGKRKQFSVKREFSLAERLVQESVIRFFDAKNMQFRRLFNPTSIIITKENLMKGIANDEIVSILPMYPEYRFDSRMIIPHNRNIVHGILIDFNVNQQIDATAQELIEKGVGIEGCYVVAGEDDSNKGFLAKNPKFSRNLLGKVISANGGVCKLEDYRENDETEAAECYLEPSTRNIRHCLSALSETDAENIQGKRLEEFFKVKGAKNQAERIEKIRVWLKSSQPFYCGGGLSFDISDDILKIGEGNEAGNYRSLHSPSYALRPGGSITVQGIIDKKIDEKGPYDTESFPKKRVRVAVLYPERFKGEVEVFFRQFLDGVPQQPGKNIPFTQGFIRKYRLVGCELKMFPITSGNEDSNGYKNASLNALQETLGFDIAMIVTREDFHQLYGEKNPYLISKSTFMSQGVPVQSVEIETIKDQRGRPWILNNIGLATYAKLGGIPYVLIAQPGLTHELIFGIGSSNVREERLGDSERFIGITTVFSGDGNYLLYNLTKEVLFEDYQEALLDSLKDAIAEVKARYAWQKGDKVRLIFHQSFKRFRNVEAKAVKELVDSITDFEVEYAFVHISTRHSWKVFDKSSPGINHWENYQKYTKGEYVPFRGSCIPLGPQAGLLTLTGPHQLKTHLQGCPEPILVSIHRESTFKSWEYLAEQIFKLTFMSWRSFFPSSTPVTIEYSDFIAKMMGALKDISYWNPDIFSTKLRESRWFL